ncbi:MAG: hypothetical protein J5636_06030 [Clostridiales bacterium]|nr:hypothetical protein [Clostridiales bacterium]
MHIFKRTCSALMAGALTVSMLAASGCGKQENKINSKGNDAGISDDISGSDEDKVLSSGNDKSTDPSDNGSSPSSALQDPIAQQALEVASDLGVDEEELHGKYELFLKYSDCVVNNPKLGEYRAYALHLFPLVADHLTAENEAFFMEKLKALQMESMMLESAAGEFYQLNDKIRIVGDGICYANEGTYTVAFHELTHFVDAFVDGEKKDDVYYVGEHFASEEELAEEDWNLLHGTYEASFITEGGAELYMAKYFSKNPQSYYCAVSFLTGLEWIYGSEALDNLFFSSDSSMKFIGMLEDAGYTCEQICNVFDSFNYYTYYRGEMPEGAVRFEDVLIDLYEHVKGPDWKDDMVFFQILWQINQAFWQDIGLCHTQLDFPDLWTYTDSVLSLIDQGANPPTQTILQVLILDDKPYYVVGLTLSDEYDSDLPTTLLIDYDFDEAKILGYEYYVHDFPDTVPQGISSSEELDEKLASLPRDHSAAHCQTAYSGSSDLQSVYDRAAEIGNKYGVFIYLGESLPSYVEHGNDIGQSDHYEMALDQIEDVLSQFPDGYFDQFAYGAYTGLELDLGYWMLWNELEVYATDAGYVMTCPIECKNENELSKVSSLLLDAIFSATDLKLKYYFENFEDPAFSEAIWITYNPDHFTYVGFSDTDWEREIYEENKAYFTTFTAMRYAPKDRSQLMTSLMENQELADPCIRKAEYYSRCIREAFDDSTWPEKTTWEDALAKQ